MVTRDVGTGLAGRVANVSALCMGKRGCEVEFSGVQDSAHGERRVAECALESGIDLL